MVRGGVCNGQKGEGSVGVCRRGEVLNVEGGERHGSYPTGKAVFGPIRGPPVFPLACTRISSHSWHQVFQATTRKTGAWPVTCPGCTQEMGDLATMRTTTLTED